jgi:hypothetical protein
MRTGVKSGWTEAERGIFRFPSLGLSDEGKIIPATRVR